LPAAGRSYGSGNAASTYDRVTPYSTKRPTYSSTTTGRAPSIGRYEYRSQTPSYYSESDRNPRFERDYKSMSRFSTDQDKSSPEDVEKTFQKLYNRYVRADSRTESCKSKSRSPESNKSRSTSRDDTHRDSVTSAGNKPVYPKFISHSEAEEEGDYDEEEEEELSPVGSDEDGEGQDDQHQKLSKAEFATGDQSSEALSPASAVDKDKDKTPTQENVKASSGTDSTPNTPDAMQATEEDSNTESQITPVPSSANLHSDVTGAGTEQLDDEDRERPRSTTNSPVSQNVATENSRSGPFSKESNFSF
uniref:Ubiquitin carboxyl-terminal hydrolase n=1 Tax=Anisakis simplex TaxID=6269 RepID=A0A0M3KG81_ANISI